MSKPYIEGESLVDVLLENIDWDAIERDKGEPEVKQIKHDVAYIGAHWEAMFAKKELWHNNALELICDVEAPGALMSLLRIASDGDQMMQGLAGIMEMVFMAGYAAGEGPEHIKKCKCGRPGSD